MHSLSFHNTQFDIIDRNNQPWLRLPQIGVALGYANPYKVQQVFDRNSDEFTDSMTALIELGTNGGKQQVRIFSLRGVHLLAMLSRTKVAKEFRRWVLDVLDGLSVPDHATGHTDIIRQTIHGRASGFPEPERRSVISRLWHEVHKEFGVFRASDIPAEQAAEVCGFVASRPLEGEYLPRSEPVPEGFVSLSEQDCHDTFHVLHHLGCIEKDMTRLIGLSQTTESPWMSGTIEHLRASTMMAKNLRARKSEIRDAYQALSNRKAS
ncbi:MAG: hypothetical protein CMI09_09280 [Oceanospirillaceae bacterium]|nr:hypothetical protein [Oceanospirillaceae bacterium]